MSEREDGPDVIGNLRREVEHLRAALAYEARVVEAQTLDVKALGEGRRRILEEQVRRMRRVALGAPHDKQWTSGFRTELRSLESEAGEERADA